MHSAIKIGPIEYIKWVLVPIKDPKMAFETLKAPKMVFADYSN